MRIEPETLHQIDDPRLNELAAALVGERLSSVRYVAPAGAGWENYSDLEHVHEVEMGVELLMDSGLLLELSWSTPGLKEGLSLTLGPVGQHAANELVSVIDVSDHVAWSGVVGHLVEAVAVSFRSHSDDSSTRPWSFRVGTSGGPGVTVALGEVRERALHYMPDNIVVIFDETRARAYQIPGSFQPAWGEVVG